MDIPSTDLPKPPAPYVEGWRFTVQPHISPPPTPVFSECCRNFRDGRAERKRLSPVERCLQHRPLPGGKGSGEAVDLEVLDLIKAGDGHKSQVFTVRILNESLPGQFPSDRKAVAKLYDPLYFYDEEGYLNPFLCVDKHYTHEVGMYEVLSDLQGGQIPQFFGSYTFDIPAGDNATREVRLILIEFIPGISMLQANPADFSKHTRQQILKVVVNFESIVFQRDIVLTDLSPRNVMMKSDVDPEKNLVFLDFEGSVFGRRLCHPLLTGPAPFLSQYISPLLRWGTDMMREFNDWKRDWDLRPWIEAEWAHTASTITPGMREHFRIV